MAETDIVERAREEAAAFSIRADDAGRLSRRMAELADEIERLRDRVAELDHECTLSMVTIAEERARATTAERALSSARAEVWAEAAGMVEPPLMHRKGNIGIWRRRRAELAAALRARAEQEQSQ